MVNLAFHPSGVDKSVNGKPCRPELRQSSLACGR